MRAAGAEVISDIRGLSVIGFFDVIKKLPKFFALKKLIRKKIKEEKPDAVILVDFSGFNLRLAKEINKTIPVIYYVSPQVWASRPGRIKTIKEYIHKMIVFFKFEEEFYKKHQIDVDCIGHPLLDAAGISMDEEEFLNKLHLSDSKTIIALLPGSRPQEVSKILPVMLKTGKLIQKKIPEVQFIIAKSAHVDINIYKRKVDKSGIGIDVKIIDNKTYECLNIAKFCLVASGTATLETAIAAKPFVIIYKMGLLNYLLYRPQVKIPYIGMVNIVAQKKIIPEFIQFSANPKKIAEEVIRILQNPSKMKQMQSELEQFRPLLGEEGASRRAARIVLEFLHQK